MKNIVIIGSGGFAKEVAFLIEDINKLQNKWNFLGFIDEKVGENNGKYQIFQNDEWLLSYKEEIYVVIGLGNPSLIKKLHDKFSQNHNIHFPNLIHPTVIGDWERIKIGIGNIICAGNIFTTDIEIGSFNIFNLSCTIGHDSKIGSFNVINPTVNISGGVQLNDEILIGTGSQILQYLEIVDKSIIGAGAVLTKSATEQGIYVGAPAKKLIKNE